MAHSPLSDWLRRLESYSPHEIELGLDRVAAVLARMALRPIPRVIHVAGTNGKGSTVAMLRSLLSSTGSIGSYTSPHVSRYNERICIDDRPADDATIIEAFERVDVARLDTRLTYFEFGTLAAVSVFESVGVDTAILEVGMGGRLDAVNAIEPDAGIITNVSLDHCEWLGNDVESIALEKAGIMRRDKPVVYAERDMPDSIARQATRCGARLIRAGQDYDWTVAEDGSWGWQGRRICLEGLRAPALAGDVQVQNAAGALALVESLELDDLLTVAGIDGTFGELSLPGRMQRLQREQDWLLDVAHNPAAARALADALGAPGERGQVALVSMLDDKDVEGIVAPLDAHVDSWIAVRAESNRAIPAVELARRISNQTNRPCLIAQSLDDAIRNARELAGPGGRILVTGSFYIVGPVMERLASG